MSGTGFYPAPQRADATFIPPPSTGAASDVSAISRRSSERNRAESAPNSKRATTARRERALHYIDETIRKQGTTVAFCARRLGVSTAEARAQADPRADLTLSQLFAWREALDVPLAELIPFVGVVPDPVRNRGLLLRIVKTARQMQEATRGGKLNAIATSLVDQLLELAPEFNAVPAWPTVGQSHAAREDGSEIRRVDSDFSKFLEERS